MLKVGRSDTDGHTYESMQNPKHGKMSKLMLKVGRSESDGHTYESIQNPKHFKIQNVQTNSEGRKVSQNSICPN